MCHVRGGNCAALALAAAVAATPGSAVEIHAPTRIADDGATCDTASIAGRRQSFAVPRSTPGKRHELLVLIAESLPSARSASLATTPPPSCCATSVGLVPTPVPTSTTTLVRWLASDPPRIETLLAQLPAEITGVVAFDVDGDSADELLVTARECVLVLRAGSDRAWREPPEPRLNDPTLNWKPGSGYSPSDLIGSDDTVSVIPAFGRRRAFTRHTTESGAAGAVERESLPLARLVESSPGGLRLSSPPVRRLGLGSDGHVLFATKPGTPSAQRSGVTLLDPRSTGETRAQELFFRLPSRERILKWRYLRDGDTAWLAVTSTSAVELELLGEKLLRSYPLEKDRTRGGATAGLALESRINLWQTANFALTDVSGDGRRDLDVAYWTGLEDDTLAIDGYLRQADTKVLPPSALIDLNADDVLDLVEAVMTSNGSVTTLQVRQSNSKPAR